MVTPTFKVDGMHFDTWEQAFLVANRLYERYDKTRSITIYSVDHHGEAIPDFVIAAEVEPEEDTEQQDLF